MKEEISFFASEPSKKEKTSGLRIQPAERFERLKNLETLENDERLSRLEKPGKICLLLCFL